MGHNFLVQNLANERINSAVEVIIEDNIGEGIHIHFRADEGFDFRMDFAISEFMEFSLLVQQISQQMKDSGQ